MAGGSPWLPNEIELVREQYLEIGPFMLSDMLPGRSAAAISNKASELGVRRRNHPWTKREEALIRRYYPNGGSAACAGLIPHRTAEQIRVRANLLGVTVDRAANQQDSAERALIEEQLREARAEIDRLKLELANQKRRADRYADHLRTGVRLLGELGDRP